MLVRTVVTAGNTVQLSLLLVAGVLISGCVAKAQGVDGNGPTGIYTLVTVNGSKLPAKALHGEVVIQVRSGTFTINADGTCSSRIIFGPPSGADFTREVNATYTREGSKLNMQWEGAGKTAGTVEGDSFTMNNEGMILAYNKQPATPASQQAITTESSPKLKALQRFIGSWEQQVVSKPAEWTPEKTTMTCPVSVNWILRGRMIEHKGIWSPGNIHALCLMAYDPEDKVYLQWYFDSAGSSPRDETRGKWDEATKTFTWTGRLANGTKSTQIHRFIDADTLEWTLVLKDRAGKVCLDMEAKAKRK